ncbi:MAG: cobalamin-dependent protein [Acidobacteriota bacterium]
MNAKEGGEREMHDELAISLVELKREAVLTLVRTRVEEGEDPLGILEECRRGMAQVGDRFQSGEFFLAEMMLAAEIFKGLVAILNPYMDKVRAPEPLGKVVLATLKGDIHDLGKNIVATLLRAQGFEVHDLGVDVSPRRVVEKVKEVNPGFVGFSALITSAFVPMKEASDLLVESGVRGRLKLMVGGGVTSAMVKDHIGADFQTTDAMDGVGYCLTTIGESEKWNKRR